MNGPLLLWRATVTFANVGYSLFLRVFGKHAKAVFWGLFVLSAVTAIVLQLRGV